MGVACMAGIYIFFDYFKGAEKGTWQITINSINWLPVDTNHLTILYATVVALSKELNIPVPGLAFDKENESFIFPERRKAIIKQ